MWDCLRVQNSGVGVGLQDWGRVRLKIEEGKVHIQSGASCIGQGVGTVLVQLVCGECGLTTDEVVWHRPNTKDAPDSGTTSGSRQTLVTGEACKRACAELKKELDLHNGSLAALEGKEFYGEYLAKRISWSGQAEPGKSCGIRICDAALHSERRRNREENRGGARCGKGSEPGCAGRTDRRRVRHERGLCADGKISA
jgi:CO/xanthine dehydrogenase Mo-binding subunit